MRCALILLAAALPILTAATEDRVRKTAPAPPNGRLVVNTEMGAIRVEPGAANVVAVDAFFRGDPPSRAEFDQMLKDFSLDVTPQGSEVRVTTRFQGVWNGSRLGFFRAGRQWCRNSGCLQYNWLREMELRISLPAQFHVSLNTSGGSISVGDLKGEVLAKTSGGSLHFGKIEGPVDGRTSGGSITVNGAKGRTMVRTSGGSIWIEGTIGDIDASTSGGSISIAKTAGRVLARTSGGSVSVRSVEGPVDASTSGGGIDVALAGNKGYEVDAATSGGGVSSEFPGLAGSERRPRRLRGAINGGGPMVRLRTSGGGIHIGKA